ncbi:allantoin racemase [Rhizobium sp. BK313]|jgi:allantoin racemase|uniref:aspartate/glutamate racemase family protein n=1 Tax=Rhizobium sp. BK313 TaxID=2587081 RepID=UPI0010607339|nr:aspartate/glutamate racemase family protein [Rhizobium sp. BK313]MBB3454306.1 allantoin racemase [Rhizobium sp. BK313]
MRIQIINPNTTHAFTERLLRSAVAIAAPGTEVLAANPDIGAASIESHAEEALGALGVMQLVTEGEANGIDGYVVACFGDTGVHQAREIARGPVVGMTEAALYAAAMIASRFAIVTLPPRTRAHSLRVLHETGLLHRCSLHAVEVPVLDLEDDVAASYPIIAAEARLAIENDRAEAIILGCAGLAEMVAPLSAELGVPVIDGVLAGLKMAEGLVATGIRTSKRSTYDFPPSGFTMPALRRPET